MKKAKVVTAGAGGLEGIASIYLTVAGVGKIRLIDHNRIELSNLNRQIFYGDKGIGKRKTEVAKERLESLNKEGSIEAINETITEDNVFIVKYLNR